MGINLNFVFCKHRGNAEHCYNNCNKKRCPSVSNLWYGYIMNPITSFIRCIKYKFQKCDQLPTKCNFLYRKKYCTLCNRCCRGDKFK